MTNFALCFLLLLLFCTSICNSYKILIYVPGLSNSQAVFNYRLGELLADHGHDVLMYRPMMHPKATKGTPKKTRELRFESLKNPQDFQGLHDELQGNIYNSTSVMQFSWELIKKFNEIMKESCEMQISNKDWMQKLKDEKFDLAIGHMYDYCPLGLFRALEIPTYIWMSSGVLLDTMAAILGCPSPPSYVPNIMSSYSDRMTPLERLQNALAQIAMNIFMDHMHNRPFTEMFRSYFGDSFPAMDYLAAHSPLVFINSEEFIDWPRPVLHKIIYIGGIKMNKPNALDQKWQKVLESGSKGTILVSFGSVANAQDMPQHWKLAFLETYANFPDYTFIWKYESDYPQAKKYKNVVLSPWIPQTDVLAHPNMRMFITHGGYNSVLESAAIGVPMITIALGGDQPSNSVKARRHGLAYAIDKTKFSAAVLTKAIETVLTDENYTLNAKKLSSMIRKKPVSSESLAVGWVEFLAEHQQLPQLQVTSVDLHWYEYLMLDVISAAIASVIIGLYFLYRILALYYWWCCQYKAPNSQYIPTTKNIKTE